MNSSPPPTDENAGKPPSWLRPARPGFKWIYRKGSGFSDGNCIADWHEAPINGIDGPADCQPPASEAGAQTPEPVNTERNNWDNITSADATARELELIHRIFGPKPEYVSADQWRENTAVCAQAIRAHVNHWLATATRELEETEKYLSSRQILRTGDGTFSAVDQSVINLVERLESDLAEARRQGQEMRKELENTRAEIALEKDVLELAQQKSWRHFREDMQAMQYRMVTQLHNIDAALATPSPQGNNEDKKP